MKYHFILVIMSIAKKKKKRRRERARTNHGENMKKREHLYTVGRKMETQEFPQETKNRTTI